MVVERLEVVVCVVLELDQLPGDWLVLLLLVAVLEDWVVVDDDPLDALPPAPALPIGIEGASTLPRIASVLFPALSLPALIRPAPLG